jgi:hypothetical protein
MDTPTITPEDWGEIYYALIDKQAKIDRGEYGDGEDGLPGSPADWSKHLGEIIDKIGPDGENMK